MINEDQAREEELHCEPVDVVCDTCGHHGAKEDFQNTPMFGDFAFCPNPECPKPDLGEYREWLADSADMKLFRKYVERKQS